MTAAEYSDEILMRFADGELDAETAERLEQAMESDDDLVARLALFIETRAAAQAALKPLLDEPVPDALKASVERMVARKRAEREDGPSNVLAFKPQARPPIISLWKLPIAASIAAAIGLGAGYWLADRPVAPTMQGIRIAGLDETSLATALDTAASGSELALARPENRFRAVATFRNGAAELCREFEVQGAADAVLAVACHVGDTWNVTFALATPGDGSGYAPVSSLETLEAYLGALEASPPMAIADEAAALEALKAAPRE
jgi:anti-sigma factor RsiW